MERHQLSGITRLSSDPASLFDDDAHLMPFATADTLSSCVLYLEPVLRDLRLKHWQLLQGDAVAVVNCLYDLVQQYQDLQSDRQMEQDELHRAKGDIKAANKTITRLQGQAEVKEQELGALNIKLRQLDAWYRQETERWASEREELCKRCSQLEQKHTQFQHELRRRDAEFERLQKHLAQQIVATERRRNIAGSSTPGGSSGTNAAGSGSFKHGRQGSTCAPFKYCAFAMAGAGNKTCIGNVISSSVQVNTRRMSKPELEDLCKRSMEALETEKQARESENAAMRKAMHSLEHEHKELLNKAHAGACSNAGSGSSKQSQKRDASMYHTEAGSLRDSGTTPGGPALAASAADPAAALYKMHSNLQALRVRKQRVAGSTPLSELQQQAESQSERLLLAKLQEAGRIMEEQETALALALKAIPGCPASD